MTSSGPSQSVPSLPQDPAAAAAQLASWRAAASSKQWMLNKVGLVANGHMCGHGLSHKRIIMLKVLNTDILHRS